MATEGSEVGAVPRHDREPQTDMRGKEKRAGSSTDLIEAEVVAANVEFYHKIADKYDQYESCTFDSVLQQMLNRDLDRIGSHFASPKRPMRCLDCGGGTGNLALKMLERGWLVTVVDVSHDMLSILRQKTEARGLEATLVNGDIKTYLDSTHAEYELVTFGSVLHHLYTYLFVIDKAAEHIRPGGFFYSNFDPVFPRWPFLARTSATVDTLFAKTLFDRSDLLTGMKRRARKLFLKADPLHKRVVDSAGDIAEYHAHAGVDDLQIISRLRGKGFRLLEHARYGAGRIPLTRFLNQRLRLLESFKLIAQRRAEVAWHQGVY